MHGAEREEEDEQPLLQWAEANMQRVVRAADEQRHQPDVQHAQRHGQEHIVEVDAEQSHERQRDDRGEGRPVQ